MITKLEFFPPKSRTRPYALEGSNRELVTKAAFTDFLIGLKQKLYIILKCSHDISAFLDIYIDIHSYYVIYILRFSSTLFAWYIF